jgi:hypothetical protein
MQETFVSRLCSQEANSFFLPCHINRHLSKSIGGVQYCAYFGGRGVGVLGFLASIFLQFLHIVLCINCVFIYVSMQQVHCSMIEIAVIIKFIIFSSI